MQTAVFTISLTAAVNNPAATNPVQNLLENNKDTDQSLPCLFHDRLAETVEKILSIE